MKDIFIALIACIALSSCASKVGSDAWCEKIKDKPKGDLSLNETKDYAKHCVLK